MAQDVTAVLDFVTTQTRITARTVAVGMYVYRFDELTWVRVVGVATADGTTRIQTQDRADALEYAADDPIDVCLALLDGDG